MLDIKLVRENPQRVKDAMRSRNKDMDAVVDELLALDVQRREAIAQSEALKAEQNQINKQIPALKKQGEDVSALLAKMKEDSAESKRLSALVTELEQKQRDLLLTIPNIPHESVPVGKDDSDNVELRKNGTPPTFDFEPKPHWDIGKALGILDPDTAAKVTGTRFHFYKGLGSRLERAIINFYLDTHTEHGYTEVFPPYMVNRASMTGTGQLPKFEEDAFHLSNEDYFLIPTAEVPVTNMYRDDIITEQLPLKFCAYSACFRAEAGSAGRDTRGLIRQHQFNKVELVKFADPETSYDELESLTNDAERVRYCLRTGGVVVAHSGGDREGYVGVFTHGGHYVTLINEEPDGRIAVLDPSYKAGKYDEEGRRGKVEMKGEFIALCDLSVLVKDVENRDPGFYLFWRA